MSRFRSFVLSVVALLAASAACRAEVVSIEVRSRTPFVGGKSFGKVGSYDLIQGIVRFAVDPRSLANREVVDLHLAPKNKDGLVEFEADMQILAPSDPAKGNGAILYDVNNRGNKLALGIFNRPPLPTKEEASAPEGDGFLMNHGFTVVWSGWIGELLPADGRLLLNVPQAKENGQLVRGPVRFEISSDSRVKSLPLSRRDGHGSYPPTTQGERDATMTMRKLESDPRIPISRNKFKLVRMPMQKREQGVAGTLPQIRCELEGGFEPGVLYEVIFEAEGSLVQGLGLAGVRDLISFLRYDTSERNPLRRPNGQVSINRAHGFGVSQSGRFLRHFLWQGFNIDEKGRLVFDGLMPHVAGGGLGFFNHRFAQPTRHNGQHEDHAYPADMFPFTYGPSKDPVTGKTDGILSHYSKNQWLPKIMHTQTAAEYWHRAGSLVHTTPDGKSDVKIPPNVRIYAFGGTQHGPASDPPRMGAGQNLPNPADFRPFLRSLLLSLDDWVRIGRNPPASVYPRLAAMSPEDLKPKPPPLGATTIRDRNWVTLPKRSMPFGIYGSSLRESLPYGWEPSGFPLWWRPVDVSHFGRVFPKLPGVVIPKVAQAPAMVANRTPVNDFDGSPEGAKIKGHYPIFVPRPDKDGNDTGTLNLPDVAVPLATYTGWNLRRKEIGAETALANLLGSYIPFTPTKTDREAKNDPRLSVGERYGSFEVYAERYKTAVDATVRDRFLIPSDAARLIAGRERHRALFPAAVEKK